PPSAKGSSSQDEPWPLITSIGPAPRSSTTVYTLVRTSWRPNRKSRSSEPVRCSLNSSIVPYHSASLGQTEAHIGERPSDVRSVHMSHFIIWSISAMYFGTPNGQASTQLEQPMQRGFRADCTMPPSVCLMASAGHTCAHVGSSQCMHTIG